MQHATRYHGWLKALKGRPGGVRVRCVIRVATMAPARRGGRAGAGETGEVCENEWEMIHSR